MNYLQVTKIRPRMEITKTNLTLELKGLKLKLNIELKGLKLKLKLMMNRNTCIGFLKKMAYPCNGALRL